MEGEATRRFSRETRSASWPIIGFKICEGRASNGSMIVYFRLLFEIIASLVGGMNFKADSRCLMERACDRLEPLHSSVTIARIRSLMQDL